MSQAESDVFDGASRAVPFRFKGEANEYFGIWIVNVALTVITFGIYSAWATVRTRRYLYGSLSLDGHSFDYHAKPMTILIGRLIAFVVFVLYFASAAISPIIQLVLMVCILGVAPELINRSLRFNMRMTSYRNVRFGFDGTYGEAFMAFIGAPIIAAFTLGIMGPWAIKKARTYIVTNSRFGQRNFTADLPMGPIAKVYFIAFGIGVIAYALLIGLMISMMSTIEAGGDPGIGFQVIPFIAIVIAFVIVPPWFGAHMTNIVANNTKLDEHQLGAKLKPFEFVWVTVSNLFLVAVSAGLFMPWAVIRSVRYVTHHMGAQIEGDLSGYVSVIAEETSAIGDEIAGAFDIEVGAI